MLVALFAMASMLAIVLAWRSPWAPAVAGPVGLAIAFAGGAAGTGELAHAARDLWRPLLAIVSVMVTTSCAAELGVFARLVTWIEPGTRGPVKRAFRLVFVISAIAAAALSNDAAVLLLTPLVIELLRSVYPQRNPKFVVPFAFAVFAAAGVAPFPTANPMNLVVASRAGIDFASYASHMVPIAIAGWIVAYGVLSWYFRDELSDEDPALGPAPPAVVLGAGGKVVFAVAAVSIASYPVMAALGQPLWAVATAAGLVCLAAAWASGIAVRRVAAGVSWELLPFLYAALVIALALSRAGAIDALAHLFATAPAPHATIGSVAAAGSAVLNNHPMSLLDSIALAGRPASHVLAALVGGDLGPRLLPTGSLAGIMWLHALRRQHVVVPLSLFVRVGVLVTIPTLATSLALLAALATGCGGGNEAPPAPRCEEIAAHMQAQMRRLDVHDVFFAHCKADEWSPEARACVMAQQVGEPKRCADKLTALQQKALTADLTQVVKHTTSVSIDVPKRPPPVPDAHPTLVVQVAADGRARVRGIAIDDTALDRALRDLVARDPQAQLIIQADPAATHGRIVDVMERAKRTGVVRIALGVSAGP